MNFIFSVALFHSSVQVSVMPSSELSLLSVCERDIRVKRVPEVLEVADSQGLHFLPHRKYFGVFRFRLGLQHLVELADGVEVALNLFGR